MNATLKKFINSGRAILCTYYVHDIDRKGTYLYNNLKND